ncbi:alpha/beta hydrolase [Krasilnikoviella flava]|uniref:Alpha/beta hydrolase family protein n=1 Tax=Krasilnikoviella flava TaxID=526729 RepID=A0A1T5K5J3_9MICO|nr:alpha/beta hydrolase [Krasilnikoviella flava]SKC59022.1 Alpha/beta hydrolase family protein [Krasilnikoviella flava]
MITPTWLRAATLVVAAAALVVVAWACATAWGAVVHCHPAYAVLLVLTLAGAVVAGVRTLRRRPARPGWRRVLRVVLLVLGAAWVVLLAWLRPFGAVEPALAAMRSDDAVTVTEGAARYVLAPADGGDGTAVFFQPGARVDARAYAAVLRPLAEAGHTVVVAKQPLGIAFLAMGAFDDARDAMPGTERWVVGGHSLGGTVAAMEADAADGDAAAPAAGLLLFASYPASDMSGTLTAAVASVSASEDGLATPAKIDASRADLPADTSFTVVEGGVHAFFGDYGPQPGDGTPTISHDDAREQISAAAVAFVDGLAR